MLPLDDTVDAMAAAPKCANEVEQCSAPVRALLVEHALWLRFDEQRRSDGRVIEYEPPEASLLDYMVTFESKTAPSAVALMVYVHTLLQAAHGLSAHWWQPAHRATASVCRLRGC